MLNMLNIKAGGRIQTGFTILKLVPITFAILVGLFLFSGTNVTSAHRIWAGIPLALPLLFYAAMGFEAACLLSGKIKNPEKLALEFNNIGRDIIKLHPNMVAIRKRVTTIVYYLKRLVKANKDIDEIISQTQDKLREILNDAKDKQRRIGTIGSKLILNNNKILTISNSNSVKRIFQGARQQKRKFEVYCLESRPALEGQLFAEDLAKSGISCTVITDASIAHMAQHSGISS